jgi:hypothetical protein
MFVLEVIQIFPSQCKSLLSSLGAFDPADTRLITFDLDRGEPCLPTLVAFQILVKFWNITVHRCIIDEGASTCIMSKVVWHKLNSTEIVPSAITLRAYDGRPSSPEGIFQNFPIELGGKTILIDIEVIDDSLDYNIFFGHSYMYAMKAIASSVFRTMMFPHNGKIITIDQLTHYEPNHYANIYNILPLVRTILDAFPVIDIGPGIFKDPSLVGTYHETPPLLNSSISTQVCVVSSNRTDIRDNTPLTDSSSPIKVPSFGELLPQEFLENTTAPLVPDSPPPLQGKIPVWETVPQAITQIPFSTPHLESKHYSSLLPSPSLTWLSPSLYGIFIHPLWFLHHLSLLRQRDYQQIGP